MNGKLDIKWVIGTGIAVLTIQVLVIKGMLSGVNSRMSSIETRLSSIEDTLMENRTLIMENKTLIEQRSCRCTNE